MADWTSKSIPMTLLLSTKNCDTVIVPVSSGVQNALWEGPNVCVSWVESGSRQLGTVHTWQQWQGMFKSSEMGCMVTNATFNTWWQRKATKSTSLLSSANRLLVMSKLPIWDQHHIWDYQHFWPRHSPEWNTSDLERPTIASIVNAQLE